MKLADLESTEIDPYIVDLVVNERLHRLGHQLNPHEQRAVIARLQGQLSDPELGCAHRHDSRGSTQNTQTRTLMGQNPSYPSPNSEYLSPQSRQETIAMRGSVGPLADMKQGARDGNRRSRPRGYEGIPSKNLLGIPWRTAFALQDDGWILRNAIIWHKPNAMPESVTDRLSGRYEHVFMFSKQPRYWFDLDPIREVYSGDRAPSRRARTGHTNKENSCTTPWTPALGSIASAEGIAGNTHQSWRRVDATHSAFRRRAFRCLPDPTPATLHPRGLQTRRHRVGPVQRFRHNRTRRATHRPPLHRHRHQPRIPRTVTQPPPTVSRRNTQLRGTRLMDHDTTNGVTP
jgi:hypothetical protein